MVTTFDAASGPRPIRVLLIDDSDAYSRSLVATLAEYPEVDVVGRARTGAEGIGLARDLAPDVVLLDLTLPDAHGLQVAFDLGRSPPPIGIVVLSSHDSPAIVKAVAEAGALFVHKSRASAELLAAVRARHRWAIEENAARFRQITETIEEVFWLTDVAKQRMIYVSPAYERIWGRSRVGLYGAPQSWLEAIHEDDRERVRRAALELQAVGQYDVHYRVVRPDGTLRWVRDKAYPIRDPDGVVRRVAGAATDVTDRRKVEQRLEDGLMLESAGRLAAQLAHDVRNILTVIQLQATALAEDVALPADARESALEILGATNTAGGLAQQLVAFTVRHASSPPPAGGTLDLVESTTRLVRMFRRALGELVRVDCLVEAEIPRVRGHARAMDQVLLNLLINARDAMPGEGRIVVGIDVRPVGDVHPPEGAAAAARWVILSVEDSGAGIAREHLSRVFEPFFTTKEPGKGTGLGLATVAELVRGHDGWIEVDSELGVGTVFRVYLPALA